MTEMNNILITGASSGIGAAFAVRCAIEGAQNLFLCGRNAERLEKVAEACRKFSTVQVNVQTKVIDVTERAAMETWLNECEQIAPLNVVFANAGVSTGQETPENVYNTFNTNIFGVVNTVMPAIEIFKNKPLKNGRAIAITSSIAGYHGLMTCPSYSASKACVKAWGEALRLALRPHGINVNVICPGFVRSRITDKNTCPMPFFMEAGDAAEMIYEGIRLNWGLIAFPAAMRLTSWLGSILPNWLSDFIYSRLPYKV